MSETNNRNAVLYGILHKAGRKFVCPQCLRSYPNLVSVMEHLDEMERDEGHKHLLEKEDIAFDVESVVEHKVFQGLQSEVQCLIAIAQASGIVFVCPECVDEDFGYFDKMNEFQFHCWSKEDARHMGLISFDQSIFGQSYCEALGKDVENLPPSINQELIGIAYVLQNKNIRVHP